MEVLKEKEQDSLIPTFEVTLSPEEADELGAFEETALSYGEAKAASSEIMEALHVPK